MHSYVTVGSFFEQKFTLRSKSIFTASFIDDMQSPQSSEGVTFQLRSGSKCFKLKCKPSCT